ncbi:MAG: ABC transporter substrate-binding protein [Eubacteriales bacterium]|nr:ABC transporter substrate-binding protein [Eubacteriales bacterium]
MKRLLSGLMAVALSFSLLSGCGRPTDAAADPAPVQPTVEAGYEEGVTTRVAALKGPTAMGLVELMAQEGEGDEAPYSFALYTAGDEIVPLLAKGEVDIALIPTNLAAVLYQKTEGGVQVLDVNAGNVLYAVSHDEGLTHLAGLQGRTVYMTGKGASPDWTLRYLLDKSGLGADAVTIEFKAEATEVLSALGQDPTAVGVLPQPFATVAMMQDPELSLNFALDEAWKQYSPDGSGIATGVTVVRTDYAQAHPAAVAQFVNDHRQSVAAAQADPVGAAALIDAQGIVKAPIAQHVIEQFDPMVAVSGQEMRDWVSGYLSMLYEIEPNAVGGALPDEGFYHLG